MSNIKQFFDLTPTIEREKKIFGEGKRNSIFVAHKKNKYIYEKVDNLIYNLSVIVCLL